MLSAFRNWRKKRRERNHFKREPEELSKQVLDVAAADESFAAFVCHRFRRPFAHSVRWSLRYGYAYLLLTLGTIAAGLAASALTAFEFGARDAIVALLGLTVAIATTLNRLWRPNVRAALRHQTANDLRREGWAFVRRQGEYAEQSDGKRLQTFTEAVEDINFVAEAIDEEKMDDAG